MESLRFRFTRILCGLVLPLCAASASETKGADATGRVTVAAAANLVYALDALTEAFQRSEPAINVTVATGASGSLVAQIRSGAPFDVFLSADVEYPQALVTSGDADPASLVVFAIGRLVLWTTKPDVALESVEATVRSPAVRKLAIANLDTAPYGRAARQALEHLGVWQDAVPKLVTGDNITQTAQFVQTGSADAGFVALSLVLSPRLRDQGRWIPVPTSLHAPLAQGAVLTNRGGKNPAAACFLAFLQGDAAREILARFGYETPPSRSSAATPPAPLLNP